MKNVTVYTIIFAVFGFLLSCVSMEVPVPRTRPVVIEPKAMENASSSSSSPIPPATPKLPEKKFFKQVELSIPITLPDGKGELNAEVFRPDKKILPKTLVIIVPGAGNISRRGESAGDGVDSYKEPIDVSTIWAKALADKGYFVLSYDKRTCTQKVSTLCKTNSQKDIELEGIASLARDLDQVYQFIVDKLSLKNDKVRLILLTSTQGAQVISLSESAKVASGIVLLSPILGSLEDMWVGGLTKAHEAANDFNRKNRLANQAESMKGFFDSFKAGHFPDTATIRGASAKFWRTWMEASAKTLQRLKEYNRPTLTIFSEKDVFKTPAIVSELDKAVKHSKSMRAKYIDSYDRNFVASGTVAPPVIEHVMQFIETLEAHETK